MIHVGLDFGTSNSSIARLKEDQVELFELDPGGINPRMLRSFIYITREQETFVGTEAVARYQALETGRPVLWESRHMGEVQMVVGGGGGPIIYWDDMFIQVDTAARGRLIQSIKSALRIPGYEGTEIFEQFYPVEDLIAILLGALRERCEAATGEQVTGVVLGRPVKFSDEPEVDARAQQTLEQAARQAGFEDIRFEYEPVAAAYLYHRQTGERQPVLVFDFGGGTLDMTVINAGGDEPPEVLATHGVLLGGDDLDRALLQPLKKHFGEGAKLRDRTPLPAHLMGMLDSWQTMVLLSRPEYRGILRAARRGSAPQAIQRLENLVYRNLGFTLFQAIETAKIQLSAAATAELEIDQDGLRLRDLLTRTQFEGLIRTELDRCDQALTEVLHLAGLQADQIQAVLRTGGSAEIPAISRLLGDRLGYDRLRPLNPFETIVGGLAVQAGAMNR